MEIYHGFESSLPVVPLQERVSRLQTVLLKMPQAGIVTEHIFLDDIYERKITIPPWTVLTGAEHKTPYRVRVERGTIAVNTDTEVKILTGPAEFDAPAGVQRAGRVFSEEVIWVDVYSNPDNCTDIAVLEDRLYVIPDIGLADSRTPEQGARVDYDKFLHQIGMTDKMVMSIAGITSDLVNMPDGFAVELRDSLIHGKGLFATENFDIGDIVCPGRLNGNRTPGGRYINHSPFPNVMPVLEGADIYAVALKSIESGDEILVDYRVSMLVNFGIAL